MRLLYDLFPCQTGSRLRGIGRFTLSLAEAMARQRGTHEMLAVANGLPVYGESTDRLRQALGELLHPTPLMTYTYADREAIPCDSVTHEALASVLINRAFDDLAPDVVVHATPFEGWGEVGVGALPEAETSPALRVAVLYDFIPWLFPKHYLDDVPGYRDWYARRLAACHRFDLLLAISNATRDDAIRLLGLPPERVVNISGAASTMFQPMADTDTPAPLDRFGICRSFVLYTGNVDYRKNQEGMLRAYAMLPPALKARHQLVLTQVLERDRFLAAARACGLQEDDVVITGHVTDAEMIALYARCALFVFPSLYEGFGLPILEAMACGAAVIAGDNSSIPEVVGRADMLFDASDPRAIAAAMQSVLDDTARRNALQDYGMARARNFTWEKSAAVAWQAITSALADKRRRQMQLAGTSMTRPRIAMVCASPTVDCAASRHLRDILPALATTFAIDLYVEEGTWVDAPAFEAAYPILPHTRLAAQQERYAALVYQIDNTPEHAFMLPLIEHMPGIAVLHDWRIDRLVHALALHAGPPDLMLAEQLYGHGVQAVVAHAEQGATFPLNRHLIESTQFLLLADSACGASWHGAADCVCASSRGWRPPILYLGATLPSAVAAYRQAIATGRSPTMKQTAGTLARLLAPIVPAVAAGFAVNDAVGGAASNAASAASDDTPVTHTQALRVLAGHLVNNRRLLRQPRLLFDVTQLARADARSGIQRVVRNIARALGHLRDLRQPLELVVQKEGRLWRASKVIAAIFTLDRVRLPGDEILIQPGDTLLMIDSSWEQYAHFAPVFTEVRQLGGSIVTVIYDLIPLQRPEACTPGLVVAFRTWFDLAIAHSDMLLCISEAVADEVRAQIAGRHPGPGHRLAIRSWPLGADLPIAPSECAIRPAVAALTAGAATAAPLFLMVGTIEPRKGHDFVLDAFEQLWARGVEVRLCIAGAVGWKTDRTVDRIRHHLQLHRNLYFVEAFSDAEICLCYGAATALIAASVAEGFGLPIVEAALHHVPTLASDIPVFREVGGTGARYFSRSHPDCLADAVLAFCSLDAAQRRDMAASIPAITWEQSARRLLDVIGVT